MVLFKSDLGLDFPGFQQGPDIPLAPGPLGQGSFVGPVDDGKGMSVDEVYQPHQGAQAAEAAILGQPTRPTPRRRFPSAVRRQTTVQK